MVSLGPIADGQMLDAAGVSAIPSSLAVRPELRDEDAAWLNSQLGLVERPDVQFARRPPPPPVWVRYSA